MTHATAPDLHTILQQEIVVMTQLDDVLKSEQAALISGNTNALAESTQTKSRVIAIVAELENVRNKRIAQLGFSDDVQGFKDYLQTNNDERLPQAWNALLQISESAKETNRTNGLLINRHLTKTQTALNALQQNNQTLYGPSGQSTVKAQNPRGLVIG
jgi:flagellar biosynthesis protein FlgN